MSSVQQQRKVVDQLRKEASIRRMPVSIAIDDLKKYIEKNQGDDCLINGFRPPKANPFREKNSCLIV